MGNWWPSKRNEPAARIAALGVSAGVALVTLWTVVNSLLEAVATAILIFGGIGGAMVWARRSMGRAGKKPFG